MATIGFAAELHRDVEYSRAEGLSLRLDASIPDGTGPFPAAIIVHGGGWVRGDRKYDVAPLFKPLADAGFAWFSIDYRLASDPLHFGIAVNDVEAAIRFVKERAQDYRIDADRIALIGESAGGQLAGMAALNNARGTSVKAVVAIYSSHRSCVSAEDIRPDSVVHPRFPAGHAARRSASRPPRAVVAYRKGARRDASFPS